ncbi:MAG TPA: HNH endonuclease signature motif containing protein [Gemmatimonadaceae bacterium]|nr:HNH endonuclease signature motif containing protein [Gemmatimonadaceae bacterium]
MRREFSKQIKRDALKRAAGKCEAEGCGALFGHKFHFDHVIADGLGGEPTLENCAVLCHACHAEKTRKHDVPLIAKTKRIQDRHNGIKKQSRFPGSRDSKFKKRMDGSVVLR